MAQCAASSKSTGKQCTRPAIVGGDVCYQHGGAAPQVQSKAAERVLETRLQGEIVRRGWEPVSDPAAALLDVAGEVVSWLALCREQLAELSALEYTGGEGVRDIRPLVALYERAQDRAAGTLAKLVSLGIQARVARSQELTAEANLAALRLLIRAARQSDKSEEELILDLLAG